MRVQGREVRRGVGTQAGALLGLLEREHEKGQERDRKLLAAATEQGDVVVTAEGHLFSGVRCDELGEQIVAEGQVVQPG